jgi:nitrogen regulatory protein P-II 1
MTDALAKVGITGMSVGEVRGFGRQRGHRAVYRGAEYRVDFVPKIKIEVIVKDDDLDAAKDVIIATSKTGVVGDGKIFVIPVSDAVRIRTGEQGDEAL